MSSDSEEEFQSADEGTESDLDSKEEKGTTSQLPTSHALAGSKHAMQTEKGILSVSKKDFPSVSLSDSVITSDENKFSATPLPTVKKFIDSNSGDSDQVVDTLRVSLDDIQITTDDPPIVEEFCKEKNEELILPNKIEEVVTSSPENEEQDSVCDKLKIDDPAESHCTSVDGLIEQPILNSQNIGDELAAHVVADVFSPSIDALAEALEEKSIQSESSKDVSPNSPAEENFQGLSDADDIKNGSSNVHPSQVRKTSKIGLKKPREKLGERLGSKRLGQKINKPLESISCDSLSQEVKPEEKDQTSPAQTNSAPIVTDDQEVSRDVDKGWGGAWGGWGSTLINAASTLTQEVGRGVGSVVELVEEGIGVPSPEELAKEQRERERMLKLWDDWGDRPLQEEVLEVVPPVTTAASTDSVASKEDLGSRNSFGGLGFGGLTSLVSGVSGALESAGSKVVYGGLDTLELIGRRTMDVLHDSDPGLRAKKDRFLERVNKPNLSAVLREAREQAVANPPPDPDSSGSSRGASTSRVSFSCLWTNSTGPAHLEALALIARQCTANTRDVVASLPSDRRDQVDDINRKIMALSEIEEENLTESSIFAERVATTIQDLHLPLNADNIAQCWSDLTTISEQYSEGSVSLLEAVASVEAGGSTVETNLIGGCVALVERLVAVAHKAAELSLISGENQDPVALAANFRELVVLGGSQLETAADAVCAGLSSTPQQEQLTPVITNIYMQVCEGSSCLQQSLVHLCTTLQLVAAQRAAAELL